MPNIESFSKAISIVERVMDRIKIENLLKNIFIKMIKPDNSHDNPIIIDVDDRVVTIACRNIFKIQFGVDLEKSVLDEDSQKLVTTNLSFSILEANENDSFSEDLSTILEILKILEKNCEHIDR